MKAMKFAAHVISILWAGFWLFFVGAQLFSEEFKFSLVGFLIGAAFTIVMIGNIVIPFKKSTLGGVILLLEGILLLAWFIIELNNPPKPSSLFVFLTLALPPLLEGIFFIISSKRREIPKEVTT